MSSARPACFLDAQRAALVQPCSCTTGGVSGAVGACLVVSRARWVLSGRGSCVRAGKGQGVGGGRNCGGDAPLGLGQLMS